MSLSFYNTLTRTQEPFEPLEPGRVRVYACGPTVYQRPHVGNYRTFVFNDLLHRYLEWKGFDVTFVTNLTDVDDKTINGALEDGVPLDEFTAPRIREFLDDLDALGVRRADAYPRATRHIDEMVGLVARLIENDRAYVVDGNVYFDVSAFPDYGKLSRIDPDEMRGGAGVGERSTVSIEELGKRDVRDFALWKAAKDVDADVGAVWQTPWGRGRPGWHIECSAMSMAELGETFDIHTGGEDLVFPHHEDEIAQSEGATGKPFVRYWLHVKHLLVNDQKMSKSLGNVYTLADLEERGFGRAAIRYLLLSAHYRHKLNFTFDGLDDAGSALRRLLDFDDRLRAASVSKDAPPSSLGGAARDAVAAFEAAMDDDLNTPVAFAALFNFVRRGNTALDEHDVVRPADRDAAVHALNSIDDVLGILSLARDEAADVDENFARWVERKLSERQDARRRRDFAAADAIRDELVESGVVVEDTPEGPRWKVAG